MVIKNKMKNTYDFLSLISMLEDKPTAVRQALTALLEIVRYKPDLKGIVKKAVSDINYLRYKETMHSLIAKDIKQVLALIEDVNGGNL